jgi:hypothetical protein
MPSETFLTFQPVNTATGKIFYAFVFCLARFCYELLNSRSLGGEKITNVRELLCLWFVKGIFFGFDVEL